MCTFHREKKENAAPSNTAIVGTGGIKAASAQKYGHIVWLAEKGARVHGRERGMSLKEKKTNGAGNVSVHHFTNPLDGTDGYEFMGRGGQAVGNGNVNNMGSSVYIDVGGASKSPIPVKRQGSSSSNEYLNLDSLSGNLGVAARRDALEAQYLDIARRESTHYLEITGARNQSEHNPSELAFPMAGTPSKRKATRGGLLATVENPVWFGFAVIILLIFSFTLFGIGVTFVYADNADGWENTNFGAVGAYAGVPLLVFGVAFLVATLFAARDFYNKKKRGTSGFLPEMAQQSIHGNQY